MKLQNNHNSTPTGHTLPHVLPTQASVKVRNCRAKDIMQICHRTWAQNQVKYKIGNTVGIYYLKNW